MRRRLLREDEAPWYNAEEEEEDEEITVEDDEEEDRASDVEDSGNDCTEERAARSSCKVRGSSLCVTKYRKKDERLLNRVLRG